MPDWRVNLINDNNIKDKYPLISGRGIQYQDTEQNKSEKNGVEIKNGICEIKSVETETYGGENDSSFISTNLNDGENENDLVYYDWPNIDNFEDVDRLFRNSDSTFGQKERIENGEEEISWFNSQSDGIYSSEIETLDGLSAYCSPNNGAPVAKKDTQEYKGDAEQFASNSTYNETSFTGFPEIDMMGTQQSIQQLVSMSPSDYLLNQSQSQSQYLESSYATLSSYSGTQCNPPLVSAGSHSLLLGGIKPSSSVEGAKCKSEEEGVICEQNGPLISSVSAADTSSVEETSFRQLQDVMNQLDIKTKLCIRDSLYRLARSVQQRNCFTNTKAGDPQFSDTPNKFAEPVNIETGTNPIDRSIAELLFHQSPGPILSDISNEHNETQDPVPVVPFAQGQFGGSSDAKSPKILD